MLRHYQAATSTPQLLQRLYSGYYRTSLAAAAAANSINHVKGRDGSCRNVIIIARDARNLCRGTVQKCLAIRRRVRYEEEEEEEDDEEGSEYGYNEDVALMEVYSQSARGEALLVTAMVDDREEEVLIFKGYSSCLTSQTPSDPSKSVLPARAVIKSVDRIRGPFNPSNVQYIEKGSTWDDFKRRLS